MKGRLLSYNPKFKKGKIRGKDNITYDFDNRDVISFITTGDELLEFDNVVSYKEKRAFRIRRI